MIRMRFAANLNENVELYREQQQTGVEDSIQQDLVKHLTDGYEDLSHLVKRMRATLSDINSSFSHPEQTANLDQCRRLHTVDCEWMNSQHVVDEIVTTTVQSVESQYFSIDINIQTQKKPLLDSSHLWGEPSGHDSSKEYVNNHSEVLLMADDEDKGFLYAMGNEYIHKSRYELPPAHQTCPVAGRCHLEGCNCLARNCLEKCSNKTVINNQMSYRNEFPKVIVHSQTNDPSGLHKTVQSSRPVNSNSRKMREIGWNRCCSLLGVSVPQNKPHKVPHRKHSTARRNRVQFCQLTKKKQSVLNLTIEIPSQTHEVFHSDADSVVYVGSTKGLSIAVQTDDSTSSDDISTVDYNSTGGPSCYDDHCRIRCGFTQISEFKDGARRHRVLCNKTDQVSAVSRVEVTITVDNSEDIAPSFMIS